ncbi:MAG: PH domain-containing protein [Ruminococcus sp.]|nr:PH domain-containing protein [Ruminococcus sp.]
MKHNDIDCIWTDKKRTLFGLPLSFTRYFITEQKLITRTGFLNVDEDEIDIYKITDKKVLLPLGQRMFGCGSILIFSRDTDTPEKEIHCIKNVREVSKLIDKYLNIMRDRYSIRGRDLMGLGHPDMVHDGDPDHHSDY